MTDWRLPENRREAFMRFYLLQLHTKGHPGLVYSWLPALAEHYSLDDQGRAWLTWLNGNTQNPVTSLLLLEASDCNPYRWRQAVAYWNEHYTRLDWDTDRRYHKARFGEATEKWADSTMLTAWHDWQSFNWDAAWAYSLGHPYMGRLSAWSMLEYARILYGARVPDAATMMLGDKGSTSHRNGLALIAGYDSVYWKHVPGDGVLADLALLAEDLLDEAWLRSQAHPDVSRLTLESALCTYKSWHKPNRRYPGVYADMGYLRLKRAEQHFGPRFGVLWRARRADLPQGLRAEDTGPITQLDKGLQNHYRLTGEQPRIEGLAFPYCTV